jgi:hypothetical protein
MEAESPHPDMRFLVLAYTVCQITPPGHSGRLDAAVAIADIEPRLDAASLEACRQRADGCVEIARQGGTRWREFVAMSDEPVTLAPPSHDLDVLLFEDEWECEFFIDEWLTHDKPTHAMPWELEEQRPDLGAVLVRCEESEFFDLLAEPQIRQELLFVPTSHIQARLDAAYDWAKETAARGIHPMLLTYEIDGKGDFAALETMPLPWVPDPLRPGDSFHYEGTMYPWPWDGTPVQTTGDFEIGKHHEDVDGQYWFEARNLHNGESLFISETLLLTATFHHDQPYARCMRVTAESDIPK